LDLNMANVTKNEPAETPTHDQREKGQGDRDRLLEEKPFDFIERTRPEDRLVGDNFRGQQTRDNVNPHIPSVSPEAVGSPIARVPNPGGIVDPKTLGMESIAGVAPPPAVNQPEQWPSLGLDHTKDASDQVQEAANRQRQMQQSLPEGVTAVDVANLMPSINEPPGSNVSTGEGGPVELPPLVLTDISPDTLVVGSGSFALTVTGSGFGPNCVVVFDDADVPTTYVSETELTADCPVAAAADVVDVEVSRGEDMSDVLSFEFTAVARMSEGKREQQRKPKKAEPPSKRAKKGKK